MTTRVIVAEDGAAAATLGHAATASSGVASARGPRSTRSRWRRPEAARNRRSWHERTPRRMTSR
ncbi:hypothetical protein ACVOMV_07375 [Mesorhizobium atlanticum]